jgi:hypothetical protein
MPAVIASAGIAVYRVRVKLRMPIRPKHTTVILPGSFA